MAQGRKRVEQLRLTGKGSANLYGEYELGGLNVLYVLADRPSAYGLPQNPLVAAGNLVGNWLSGVATAGVLTLLPFWLLFRRKESLAAQVTVEPQKGE
ncbi:MAG: hypothetical protein GWN58_01060 [Anaerolineae bacterium]|nr:hypothetical protein [Anaerolineae bacterium]